MHTPELNLPSRWYDKVAVAAAPWALSWCALALLELTLGATLSKGVLRRELLPVWARVAALATNLAYLAGAVLLIGVVVELVRRAFSLRFFTVRHPLVERIAHGAKTILPVLTIAVCATAYTLSWGTYNHLGAFPDREALLFLSISGAQLARHLIQQSAFLALLLPVGALSLTSASWLVGRRLARLSARFLRSLLVGALVSSGVVTLYAILAHQGAHRLHQEVHDPATGAVIPLPDALAHERNRHSGAFATAVFNVQKAFRNPAEFGPPRPDISFERRPIIPISEYAAAAKAKGFHQHNVIVVLIESLRRDELSQLRPEEEKHLPPTLPNLDSVVAEARLFTNAYTHASHSDYADTCPLSSQVPLRGPYGNRAYRPNPPYPRVLIYDVLQALGWRTALISSQNETWGGMIDFLDTGGLDFILHSETFDGPTYVPRRETGFGRWVKGSKRAGKIDDRHTVGEAIRWIGDRAPEQPFFIYMNLQNSHTPYEIPADFPRRFAAEDATFTYTFHELPPEQVPVARSLYRDALAYVDAQLGRLIQHLKDIGTWDDTILVVTGDTGQAFMEHGFVAHGRDLYNEVVQVPLVVRAPGLPPGTNDELARTIDVPPTILGLLGLPPHPSFHGVDLINAPPETRSAYLLVRTSLARQYAVVRNDMKLIKDVGRGRTLLYDLRHDPGEKHELSRLRPTLTADLEARVDTWVRETLAYYDDQQRQAREYPPAFLD